MQGWSSRTQQPLGCKQDMPPGGILLIPSVAFLGEGEVYLWGEPILRQEWPGGDSQREEGMSGKYQGLLKLAAYSVCSGATNR